MNHVAKKNTGFTLVELMLAMAFLSGLLLIIALTIIQIGAIYNQGTTLREVNQASRDISEDLRRSIASAGSLDLTTDYVLRPNATSPAGGRLCLGTYSYIWNYAKTPDGSADLTRLGSSSSSPRVILVKVPDAGKIYCAKDSGGAITNKNIRELDVPLTQELLKAGDHELGVHNISFNSPIPASATNDAIGQSLYSITYTIGTNKVVAMNADQTACLPAGDANSDLLYCQVQQFTLVVRAGR